MNPKVLTFLPLVEHGGPWMIHAILLRVAKSLPTGLVNALLHDVCRFVSPKDNVKREMAGLPNEV